MARAESKEILGYLAISPQHYAAILSLVAPATPMTRMLDPYAGEGEFLEAAATAWNVTPYSNELDGERAQKCIERFGPTQAVRCDVERLVASNEAFGILWANSPYDHDKLAKASKRVEFAYLRHTWKWAADGAIIVWVVYKPHLTDEIRTVKKQCRWGKNGKENGRPESAVLPGACSSQLQSYWSSRNLSEQSPSLHRSIFIQRIQFPYYAHLVRLSTLD